MIIAGFLSADRIEAGAITANKLASDVGSSLDLSSNTSIRLIVEDIDDVKTDVGASVKSVLVEYKLSSSPIEPEVSGDPYATWNVIAPQWVDGAYMWQRTTTTYNDSTEHPTTVTTTNITGATGADGQDGTDGRSITSVTVEYALHNDPYTAPITGWTTTAPDWAYGTYLWLRHKFIYDNDTANPVYSSPWCDSSWQAIEIIQSGGENLLIGTSNEEKETEAVVDTPLSFPTVESSDGFITLSNYPDSNGYVWVSFRANVATSGYRIALRCVSTASSTLNNFVLRYGTLGVQAGDERYIYPTIGDNGWQTISAKIPATTKIYPILEHYGEGTATKVVYHSPKLELGAYPTQWSPSSVDVDDAISGIEVGGRNLIHKTLYANTEYPFMINGLNAGMILYSDGNLEAVNHGSKITVASGSDVVLSAPTMAFGSAETTTLLGLTAGSTYTFSADVSAKLLSNNTNNTIYYLFAKLYHDGVSAGVFAEGSSYEIFAYPKADKGTTKTGRIEWTFEIPDTANKLYIKIFTATASSTAVASSSFAVGDFISLENIKLENGNKATAWTPAPEDYQEAIGNVQESVDATAENLNTYQVNTRTTIEQMNNDFTLRVESVKTYTDNKTAEVQTSVTQLSARTGTMEAKVQSLQDGLGTHVIIEPEMVRVTQDQNELCEMQLYSDRMDFVNTNGDVAASFGISGAYADRLRSNKTLSVGTDGENGFGWFDFTMMATGMAEKWRGTDGFSYSLHITKQPQDSGTGFKVSAIGKGSLTYQWQYSPDNGETWANVSSGGTQAEYWPGVTFNRDVLYLYRCVISDESNESKASDEVRAFGLDAPKLIVNTQGEENGTIVLKTLAVSDSAVTYQWYELVGNSWNVISNATMAKYFPQADGTYACVVSNSNGCNASKVFEIVLS